MRLLFLILISSLLSCSRESRPEDVDLKFSKREALESMRRHLICYKKEGWCFCYNRTTWEDKVRIPVCNFGHESAFSFQSCVAVRAFGLQLQELDEDDH